MPKKRHKPEEILRQDPRRRRHGVSGAALTGDRTKLGKISKRGNKYLRTLFVQAAHVVLVRRPATAMRGLWPWIEQASKRLAHRNLLAIARHAH